MRTAVALLLTLTTLAAEARPKLSTAHIEALAKVAATAVGDQRTPENAQCMVHLGVITCHWELPTDYTPDALDATFSEADGSLIQAVIEPGC